MLSRVADTIYWLGRYMERTHAMLQVVRIHYISSQDDPAYGSWQPLLHTYGDLPPAEVGQNAQNTSRALEHLLVDRHNAASVYHNVRQGRENARAVQDYITKEVWQSLNDYYHAVRDPEMARQLLFEDPVSSIDTLMRYGLLYTGTVEHTMARTEGYVYLNIGKFLERALQTTDIVRLQWQALSRQDLPPVGAPALRSVLYSLFGFEQYMKTYKGHLTPASVWQFVLHNPHFPHALSYSLQRMSQALGKLKDDSLPASYEQVRFLLGKTRNTVEYHAPGTDDLAAQDAFLGRLRQDLLDLANAFNQYYFGHS